MAKDSSKDSNKIGGKKLADAKVTSLPDTAANRGEKTAKKVSLDKQINASKTTRTKQVTEGKATDSAVIEKTTKQKVLDSKSKLVPLKHNKISLATTTTDDKKSIGNEAISEDKAVSVKAASLQGVGFSKKKEATAANLNRKAKAPVKSAVKPTVERIVRVGSSKRSKKVSSEQNDAVLSPIAEAMALADIAVDKPTSDNVVSGFESLGSVTQTLVAVASERKPMTDKFGRAYGTGRRKEAVARVWIKLGTGKFHINKGRNLDQYFSRPPLRDIILRPFIATNCVDRYDVTCTLSGGGLSGQAGALRHGISRALLNFAPDLHNLLKANELLTRDSRSVERKKYGRKKARKRFQFSKR